MIQTVTILLETMRMLRARFLFWASATLSVLLLVLYASIGYAGESWSIFFGASEFHGSSWAMDEQSNSVLYQQVFRDAIVPYWLGSGFILLSLLTTASVFPEFIRGGLIEVSLSKPISRVRLILLKYLSCLIYVGSLLLVLCLIGVISIYLRTGVLNLSLFWVVPIVTFAYSCYAVIMAWVGVITRSSLMALMAAVFLSAASWGLQIAQQGVESGVAQIEAMHLDEEPDELIKLKQSQRYLSTVNRLLPNVAAITDRLESVIQIKGEIRTVGGTATASKGNPWWVAALFQVVVLSFTCWQFRRRDYN
ncbi:hypothetical protein [Rubritalea marina]|uniref:hypothetical protein n=1 Tax=Rubritalea marina TaxID=361055 RepID=UPI00036FA9E9|nr:hypothetical protein [Rubritalea marina]